MFRHAIVFIKMRVIYLQISLLVTSGLYLNAFKYRSENFAEEARNKYSTYKESL